MTTIKNTSDILQRLKKLDMELEKTEHDYKKLDQISMLSGEGNTLLEKINKLKGGIEQLEWVIKH